MFIRQLLIAINEIGFYYLIIRFIWYLNYYDRGCPHRIKQGAHYNQGCQLVGTHDAIEITMFQANNFFCDTFVRMCLHHVISYIFLLPFNQGAESPALIGNASELSSHSQNRKVKSVGTRASQQIVSALGRMTIPACEDDWYNCTSKLTSLNGLAHFSLCAGVRHYLCKHNNELRSDFWHVLMLSIVRWKEIRSLWR